MSKCKPVHLIHRGELELAPRKPTPWYSGAYYYPIRSGLYEVEKIVRYGHPQPKPFFVYYNAEERDWIAMIDIRGYAWRGLSTPPVVRTKAPGSYTTVDVTSRFVTVHIDMPFNLQQHEVLELAKCLLDRSLDAIDPHFTPMRRKRICRDAL